MFYAKSTTDCVSQLCKPDIKGIWTCEIAILGTLVLIFYLKLNFQYLNGFHTRNIGDSVLMKAPGVARNFDMFETRL